MSLRPGQAARRGWPPFFMPDRGKVSGLRLSRDLPQPPAVFHEAHAVNVDLPEVLSRAGDAGARFLA